MSNITSDEPAMTARMDATAKQSYGLPDDYNPSDYPPVKMRNNKGENCSETQRKRRSKNRLSNRRSTGFIPKEQVETALKMGPDEK